jgi:hypothetical protein
VEGDGAMADGVSEEGCELSSGTPPPHADNVSREMAKIIIINPKNNFLNPFNMYLLILSCFFCYLNMSSVTMVYFMTLVPDRMDRGFLPSGDGQFPAASERNL